MANCIIHSIPLMEFKFEKSLMTARFDFGRVVTLMTYVWYIEGTRERILVDAGPSIDYMSRVRGVPVREVQSIDAGLGKLGIARDDIDLVVLTHLHHDHVGQASCFPNAKFLVQEDELRFARAPHPLAAYAYPQHYFDRLRFEVISGDTKINDEVTVISTPGHSPGGQSVAVKTPAGTVVIPGLCSIQENFSPPPSVVLPVILPGFYLDAVEAYASILRIKQMADILLPPHEPCLGERIGAMPPKDLGSSTNV